MSENRITVSDCVIAAFNEFGLPPKEVSSYRRPTARPRQLAMWLARELTNHSLPQIGLYAGGRDHTTVINSILVITKLRDRDPAFRALADRLIYSLSQRDSRQIEMAV